MAQGVATMAESHSMMLRVAGPSSWPNRPAHTGTENIMALPAPKPATARARISRRLSWSWASAALAGSNGVAG